MRKVGVWIDHRKAIITAIDAGNETHQVIETEVERHPGPEGSRRTSTPYGPQVENMHHKREGRERQHAIAFYKDVIKAIGKPDHLLVMGPAEAKLEFAALVEKTAQMHGVQVTVEAADRMTEAQVAAKVRGFEVK